MTTAGTSIRMAREAAGLTQRQLGERLGISQPAVARMENAGDNITVATFRRVIWALERPLTIVIGEPHPANVDPTLVASMLRIPPEQRIERFERTYANVRELALAGERARGVS